MANGIQVGDVVQLNSGGPLMTVKRIGRVAKKPAAWCAWFDGTEKRTGVYPIATLVKED